MLATIVSSFIVFAVVLMLLYVVKMLLSLVGIEVPQPFAIVAVVLVVVFVAARHHLGFDF